MIKKQNISFQKFFRLCISIASFSVLSCGHKEVAVTQGAEQILVAETIHELRGCEKKGLFSVTKPEGLASGQGLEDVLESKARLQAKEMGATHVLLKEKAVNSRAYEAFRCK